MSIQVERHKGNIINNSSQPEVFWTDTSPGIAFMGMAERLLEINHAIEASQGEANAELALQWLQKRIRIKRYKRTLKKKKG